MVTCTNFQTNIVITKLGMNLKTYRKCTSSVVSHNTQKTISGTLFDNSVFCALIALLSTSLNYQPVTTILSIALHLAFSVVSVVSGNQLIPLQNPLKSSI